MGGENVAFQTIKYWAEQTEKYSNGRIKVDLYPFMGLGIKPADMMDAIGLGELEVGEFVGAYVGGKYPFLLVRENYMVPSDPDVLRYVDKQLQPMYLEVMHGANNELLIQGISPPITIYSNQEMTSWKDLEGQILRSYGVGPTMLYEELGIEAVSMPAAEMLEGTKRGTIQGFITDWVTGPVVLKAYEFIKSVMDVDLTPIVHVTVIKKDLLDSLPADMQQAVRKAAEDATELHYRLNKEKSAEGKLLMKVKGVNIVPWPAEAREKEVIAGKRLLEYWREGVDPKYHKWADVMVQALADKGYKLYE